MYQVCELLDYFQLPCRVVGGHYGKNKLLKVLSNCVRAVELLPAAASQRPDLAVSHGSRAQILVCKPLGIPTLAICDYEHSTRTGFIHPDWVLIPDVIPNTAMGDRPDRVLTYPGIKEDVYIPHFRPDPAILDQLKLSGNDLIVTIRPPATEAHYHNPESEVLFAESVRLIVEKPGAHMVVLPRNDRQNQQLRTQYSSLLASRRMTIPDGPVNGLNLIWFSDLVISGGGTMNREAAALGVPVYSIFRGKIGAVDRYLSQQGRLMLLETTQDVRTRIALTHWNRPQQPRPHSEDVLNSVVHSVIGILEGRPQSPPRFATPQSR